MSISLNCLIVDDEPLSRQVVEKYIDDLDQLVLAGACSNAVEALEVLRVKKIDLLFLDINMPRLSGLDLVRSLENPPLVIFTTAYPEYAVEGFELDVLDYLVKPFGFERFVKAVNKAFSRISSVEGITELHDTITIKSDKKLFPLNMKDIRFIEAMGDYLKVHTENGMLITHETMKNINTKLPASLFIRIHKSFLINIDQISFIEGNMISIGDQKLPIGGAYKEGLFQRLKKSE